MKKQVIELLAGIGVKGAETDPLLDLVIQSITCMIQNATNQNRIPDKLAAAAIYNAAGQYLKLKKDAGQLDGINIESAVKQIQEGDTNIVYAVGDGDMTPEGRIESLIAWMMEQGKNQYSHYRKLTW